MQWQQVGCVRKLGSSEAGPAASVDRDVRLGLMMAHAMAVDRSTQRMHVDQHAVRCMWQQVGCVRDLGSIETGRAMLLLPLSGTHRLSTCV